MKWEIFFYKRYTNYTQVQANILIGIFLLLFAGCLNQNTSSEVNSVSGVNPLKTTTKNTNKPSDNMEKKTVIFLYSFHHGNTRKIANAIAPKINASIQDIDKMDIDNINFSVLEECELIGFGSGIDSDKHYQLMLDFAEKLPNVQDKKAFIFSTSGIYSKKKMLNDHETLRNILQNKGFVIVGEFGCPGHNTNSFLKHLGGMNKGRPNEQDLKNAELFAKELLE